MDKLDDIPWRKEKEAFEAIAELGSYGALSEEDRNRYDDAQRNYWDSIAVYEGAVELGEERGIEKGEHNKAIETAMKMLADACPDSLIIKYTGLNETELKGLKKQLPQS